MGGGSSGGGSQSITTIPGNPKVPSGFGGFAELLKLLGGGLMSNPVNLGSLPGVDAPKAGPLIPQASMGNMFSNPAFQMGANRMNATGTGSMPRRPARNTYQTPGAGRTYGDLFTMSAPTPRTASIPTNMS